jgi:hypothetical protein
MGDVNMTFDKNTFEQLGFKEHKSEDDTIEWIKEDMCVYQDDEDKDDSWVISTRYNFESGFTFEQAVSKIKELI